MITYPAIPQDAADSLHQKKTPDPFLAEVHKEGGKIFSSTNWQMI